MLLLLLAALGVLILIECGFFSNHPAIAKLKLDLDATKWLLVIGIFFAACGWIISSMVTMRNSVKQHTINTLLQTRLSVTYMTEARHINKFLTGAGYSPQKVAPFELINGDDNNRAAVDYILNFHEFLAVGIRHGDLHEEVLKDSMRGIVVNFSRTTQPYIDDAREIVKGKARSPRTYENLIWLRDRWDD